MTVKYELREHVALVTLNDPAKRNALSRAIVRGMLLALERARQEGARGVVIAAEGRVFCAGANMDDLRDGWMDGSEPDTDPVNLFKALTEMPVPVIAAVHGPALGGGFELTMCCDLVVASDAAWFALPELGVGVIPNTATAVLSSLVGVRKAMEIMLLREHITAEVAHKLSLISARVPAGQELADALEMAGRICRTSTPSALGVAKREMWACQAIDWERARTALRHVNRAEWEEGLSAFTSRRAFDHEKFWQ